jgi:lysophospholipase L1-like esterase
MLEVLIVVCLVGVMLAGFALQKRSRPLRSVGLSLGITYVTTLLIVGGIEGYMRCCYAVSDNVPTLGMQNWTARYVQKNSLGYRDREWTAADVEGKTLVMVVGDSFTEGNGIDNPTDRVSDVLGAHLGANYAVLNMGLSGTATVEQLESLKSHPLRDPDIVIWQYFLNDINYSGMKLGLTPDMPPMPVLARESHLANFLYWRYFVPTSVRATDGTEWTNWWEWTYAAYDNAGIWQVHREELYDMVDYVESINAELIVLVYPDLNQVMRSIPYVDRVAQAIEERGVPSENIVRLFDAAAGWDQSDLRVSRYDSHPSVSFNHYVGDYLFQTFFSEGNP